MKIKFIIILLFFSISTAYSQMSFDLKGYGKIPYQKDADKYVVTFKDYGSFDFKGTVEPLNLESTITIEEMRNIPGYEVLKNLEVEEVSMKLSSEGFGIESKADTKKKLKTVCEALKIDAPYVVLSAEVTKNSFEMEGALDFSADPIVIDISEKAGTRIQLKKFRIGAELEVGMGFDAVVYFKNDITFRPTKHDKDLETVLALSFNLMNLELKGAISMTDTWQDPFGMSHYLDINKNDVVVADVAVELGWAIGSPTPTTIGFAVGYAKLFDIKFGMMMSIAPVDAEIAFKAYTKRITLKQFENTLRKMGLKIPTGTFPQGNDYYVDDTYILFAPSGGSVGEFEIEQGFAFRGGVQFGNYMDGHVNFFANLDDGFELEMYMNARKMNQMIKAAIKKEKDPTVRKALETMFNTLHINEILVYMSANTNMDLKGKVKCDMVVFGNNVKFDFEGSCNPKQILEDLMKELTDEALKYLEKIGKEVAKVAKKAADASIKTAEKGWAEVSKRAGDVAEYRNHNPITDSKHRSGDRCKTHCVPNRAKEMGNPVYNKSNKAVRDFYYKVIPKLAKIDDPQERKKLIWDDWKRLADNINNNWAKVRKDREYWGYDKDKKDVERYGRQYRSLIDAKKAKHEKYRKDIWNKLMHENFKPKPIADKFNELKDVYFISSRSDADLYFDIPGYHFKAEKEKATEIGLWTNDGGIDQFIKVIPTGEEGYVYLQAQHSNYVFDIKGKNTQIGAKIALWPKRNKGKDVQYFKMIKVPGTKNIFYIQNKVSGYYLTSNGKGKKITQEKYTRARNQQWKFETAYASDMAPIPTENYAFKNVKANRYTDLSGANENAKTKNTHIKLWSMDHDPDRYNMIFNAPIKGYYHIQPLHSKYVWDMEGGKKNNGTKLQLWDLHKGGGQQFRFIFAGSPMTFYIENPVSGRFLDASNSKIKQNGCPIMLWDAHGGNNQKWQLTYVPKWQIPPKNQKFHIKMAYSNKYWDLGGDGAETNKNGKDFKLWSLNNGGDRKFKIIPSGDHSWVYIQVQNGGRYVDIQGGKNKNGTPIQLYDRNNSKAQKFAIQFTSPTTFVLRTKWWKAVDVKGGRNKIDDNGSKLHTWSTHYGPSQQFQLIYADGPRKGKAFNFLKGK